MGLRKFVSIAAVMLLMLALSGCGGSSAPAEDTTQPPETTNPAYLATELQMVVTYENVGDLENYKNLTLLDATGSTAYPALEVYARNHPEVQVIYTVSLGKKEVAHGIPEITLTAVPDEGYHLSEWQVVEGDVTLEGSSFRMPEGNVVLRAVFAENAPPAPNEFTITFDGNGGTPTVGSMTTTDGRLPSLPGAYRGGGYGFDGWYTARIGGRRITTSTVFSADTTVYAHWVYAGGYAVVYDPPVTRYTLRFETGGGSAVADVQGSYNTYVDLTRYAPTRHGYTFIGWYRDRALTDKTSGVYLTGDMTVYAGWRADEQPGTGVTNPFADVSERDWFHGDVLFVYENGLMRGMAEELFQPHGTATRAMMATILWRMEGSPAPKGRSAFADVEAGAWYADAIAWTAENGIFAGYGADRFGPDDLITREQLAVILCRYADFRGRALTGKGELDRFRDADRITDYARTAMGQAVGSGWMQGRVGDLLDPQGTATRAEIAAMLHRFIAEDDGGQR